MFVRSVSSLFFLLLLMFELNEAVFLAKPNCTERCGDVLIPYPFGIGAGCYMRKEFEVSCDNSSSPPTILLTSIKMEVLNISLEQQNHRIIVKNPMISYNCSGRATGHAVNLTGSPFMFSETLNKFFAVGCNSRAIMTNVEPILVGCESTCKENKPSGLGSNACSGERCCQTVIPSGLQVFNATFEGESEGCKMAFLADQHWFLANVTRLNATGAIATDPNAVQNMTYVQAVLDWVIRSEEASELEGPRGGSSSYSYNCYSTSELSNSTNQCFCNHGYEGNPYLSNCQDINECEDSYRHNLCGGSRCVNRPGYYTCESRKTWIIILGVSLGFGVVFLFVGGWRLYKIFKQRRKAKLQRKFFKRNGGLLLQQQLSSSEGNVDKTKVFTSKELEKATDYFNRNRILGQGGQGTVYKGMLVDGRIVAVKKSKVMDEEKVEEFINEVVILSQINHRNVVKLLGCCLETEVPLLVYEFIPNGTLFQYIHGKNEEFLLSWEVRLRIATEVAGALAYLHSAASIPIYHRDIKSSNILLDEKYRAKVSDFGTSRSIAIDQTHLTTHVQGTFGYLDPEYFQSSQFTEKSDVYSFGVVLVELLTGEKPVSLARAEEGRSLATHFILSMEQDRLFDILDARIKEDSAKAEIIAVAKLANRCLYLSGRKRPTMKEVAMELERIRLLLRKDVNTQQSLEKIEYCSNEVNNYPWDASNAWESTSISTGSGTTFSLDIEPLISSEFK